MKKLILFIIVTPLIVFAKEPSSDGSIFTLLSKDAPYTPTSDKKHNYRYRALFYQDYHNEVPGSLSVEKIQRPNSMGLPFVEIWKKKINLDKTPGLKKVLRKLGFEDRIGCCDLTELRWTKDFRLKFNTTVSKRDYVCISSDVRKSQNPKFKCSKQ